MYLSRTREFSMSIAWYALFLVACNGSVHPPALKDSSIQHPAGTPAASRSALIRELQVLQTRIASHNKEIGKLFVFPVPDSLLSLYSAGSAFNSVWRKD